MPMIVKTRLISHAAAQIVILFFSGVLCSAQDCLIDHKWLPADLNLPPALANAPIVLVGTILSDRRVGQPKPSSWEAGFSVQLAELTVGVETVLRGDLNPGKQNFYTFYHGDSWEGVPTLGSWRSDPRHLRKLFFLKRDCGVVRLTCDVTKACLFDVLSGSHSDSESYKKLALGEALAKFLFTKGNRVTDQDFAESLWASTRLIPQKEAKPYLVSLTQSPNRLIRHESCIALREGINVSEAQMPSVCRNKRDRPNPADTKGGCEVMKAAGAVPPQQECK